MRVIVPISVGGWARLFSRWDVLAMLLILGFLVFLAEASRHLFEPLTELRSQPLSLDPRNLPEYAARTTLRMLIAMVLSLIFTFTYATLAARNKYAEKLLVPLLDILQSVPILGFISITVVFFMALAPGRVLGAEFAAIFAIFTSQAWNMAFSFYQSLRTVPAELEEATRNFRLTPWMRFWRLDVPFAMPQLIWNMMMSMSGSWFFVVASESISVGKTTVTLPGVGSYIALAIEQRDLHAVLWAIAAMLVVILIYDQVLFRPLVAWADRFRFEQEPGGIPPRSWVFDVLRRSGFVEGLVRPFAAWWRSTMRPQPNVVAAPGKSLLKERNGWLMYLMASLAIILIAFVLWRVVSFFSHDIGLADVATTLLLGLATLARVVVLIAIASVIWVPIGVWVGTRPRAAELVQPIAQFLAAFPANLLFPIVVSIIVAWKLSPNIWLSPLMILGTQWYILFNVIAGAVAIPAELRACGANLRVRGWLWWRRIALPAVFPYYVTGAITASGGSWNASIVAEVASWGDVHLHADGLGAYIAHQTDVGDFHRIVLGIAVMSLFVVIINRLFWRPLYLYAERKFRLG
ncbi:MAG TPA: ABC transporter permease subunit [Xanthobacteraceae bacterium]|nr:ABC transporter permease subunit [Xanthobacteraceae bacterium]HUN95699.1 ABC transporter permease subunit [Bradyrhizobium sp.]